MISLTCAKCQTLLTLDDAFAGAVCRCQTCGALQKVPLNAKRPHRLRSPLDAAPQPDQSATLASLAEALDPSLAGSVEASAPADSGETAETVPDIAYTPPDEPAAPRHPPQASRNQRVIVFAAAGAAVIALIIVIIVMMRPQQAPPPAVAPAPMAAPAPVALPAPPPQPAPAQVVTVAPSAAPVVVAPEPPKAAPGPAKPSFLGLDLSRESTVIFLLDHGNVTGTDAKFDFARLACYKAIQSMGHTRKFQIILWDTSGGTRDEIAFPPVSEQPVPATPANLDACRKALDDTYADGQSDVKSALVKALDRKPSAIVIVTAKMMDDDFTNTVLQLRSESGPRIDCLSLGLGEESGPMSVVAKRTGGVYNDISLGDLQAYAQ